MYKLLAVLLLSAFTTAQAAPEPRHTTRSTTSRDAATQQQGRAQTDELSPIVQALLEEKKKTTNIKVKQ